MKLIIEFFVNVWERVGEERERENPKQALSSAKPDTGLKLMNRGIMTWAKIKSRMLNQLSHPGTPIIEFVWVKTWKQSHYFVLRNWGKDQWNDLKFQKYLMP